MRIGVLAAALALAVMAMGSGAEAASIREVGGPAEIPPPSYKGKQYVDSRGCVFVRAGYGNRVTWVPRVNRRREVYCSPQNKPSLSPSQLAALGAPVKVVRERPAPAAKPALRVAAVSATTAPEPAPQPEARPARQVASVSATTAPRPPEGKVRVVRAGRPQAVHPGDLVRAQRAASGRDGAFDPAPRAEVPRNRRVVVVRAGEPQAVHPGDLMRQRRLAAARAANASAVQTAPRPVAAVRAAPARKAAPVRYRDPVHGLTTVGTTIAADVTPEGDAQMRRIWTDTVPRRLILQKVRVREVAGVPVRTRVSTKSVRADER